MNAGALAGNLAWLAASAGEWLRFRHAAKCLERTQRQRLHYYLSSNADTVFGRDHSFARIRCWEDYVNGVPVRDFDELKPYIQQIAAGERRVLTADRVRLFEPSSGSTGAEKWVPYTANLQAEFRRAVAVWLGQTFLAYPSLMAGPAYWSLTPAVRVSERSDSAIPIGFDTDGDYLGGVARRLIRLTLANGPQLGQIADMEMFWRVTLLMLLKCRDLRMFSVWHPSFLILLLQQMRRQWDGLLKDVYTGLTIKEPELVIPADVSRARELEKLGPGKHEEIWPWLRLISCWADAHAGGFLHQVKAAFPGACLQPKGLVATEAFVTIPLGDLRPLAIRSHFFEFLDEDEKSFAPWQLKLGQIVQVVVTTGGGLYRYRLGDQVEVNGFFGEIPSLRFLGRSDDVSDHFGEKLSEQFVANALHHIFQAANVRAEFAMLAMDEPDHCQAYSLFLESPDDIPSSVEERLDVELRRNPHYDLCIRLGQIKAARVVRVPAGAFERYSQRLAEQGMRLGDIKPTALSRQNNWREFLLNVDRSQLSQLDQRYQPKNRPVR